jgi:hypothetical protein
VIGTSRCKLHKVTLEPDSARVHYGSPGLPVAYEAARAMLFPYARSHFLAPKADAAGLPQRRNVLCCPLCRVAESHWLASVATSAA